MESQPAEYRNLLWMLFTDAELRRVIADWQTQAPRILSSFRRDYARADGDPAIGHLVKELTAHSPEFRQWWHRHEVDAPLSTPMKVVRIGGADENLVYIGGISCIRMKIA